MTFVTFGALRAICFDLDNTLWHVDPVLVRAEARLESWLRERYPRIPERWNSAAMHAARRALAAEHAHRAHDFTWLRTESMARFAREVGYPDSMASEAFTAFYAWRNEIAPFADVEPALATLGQHFALATLSNGNADLGVIGLARYFTVSLAANDVGVAKPAARAFIAVAEAMGCAPRELLYVGDDPEVDIAGARAAGLRTAWMNRFGRDWPAALTPADLTVVDCRELVAQIQGWP